MTDAARNRYRTEEGRNRVRSTEGSRPSRPKFRRGDVGADGCAPRGRNGRNKRPIRLQERRRTGPDVSDPKRARPAGHRGHRPRRTSRSRRGNRLRLRAWLADRLGRGMSRAWDSYRRARPHARRAARHATMSALGMPRDRKRSERRWRDERDALSEYGPGTTIAQARLRLPLESVATEKPRLGCVGACCNAPFTVQ